MSLPRVPEIFLEKLISGRGDVKWPSRSPNSTPMDFFTKRFIIRKFYHFLEKIKTTFRQWSQDKYFLGLPHIFPPAIPHPRIYISSGSSHDVTFTWPHKQPTPETQSAPWSWPISLALLLDTQRITKREKKTRSAPLITLFVHNRIFAFLSLPLLHEYASHWLHLGSQKEISSIRYRRGARSLNKEFYSYLGKALNKPDVKTYPEWIIRRA